MQREVVALCGVAVVLVAAAVLTWSADTSPHGPTTLYSDMEDFLALDPAEVEKANPLMAPDRTSESLFVVVDELRDHLEMLLGQLNGRIADADCDGVKRIASGLDTEQTQFASVRAQYDTLEDSDQRAVAQYVQERLTPVVEEVESKIVTHLLSCEESTRRYASVVAPVSLLQDKVDEMIDDFTAAITKDVNQGCGLMQVKFQEFTNLMANLYDGAEHKLELMRTKGYVIAEEKADLELESRIEPIERKFFLAYDAEWQKSCAPIVLKTFGQGAASGSDSGSGSGSDSAAAASSGSA